MVRLEWAADTLAQIAMCAANIPVSSRTQLMRRWGWLLFTTIVMALAIASRYFGVAEVDGSPASLLFRCAMLVAHFSALAALLLLPVLVLVLSGARPVLVIPLAVLCSTAILCGLLLDTQVYQLYRFHINAGVVNLLFGGAARETFRFSGMM
jgi:membrane-anchored protein YejM (alkaline phosphatase superfamily)